MMSVDKVIVALDVDTAEEAFDVIDKLPSINCFKVGWQLFLDHGLDIVRALNDMNLDVFLDLKIDDIPNTVENAVRRATELPNVKFFTFQGDEDTLYACRQGSQNENTKFLFVPSLSSRDDDRTLYSQRLRQMVAAKPDGIIASGIRIRHCRRVYRHMMIVAPGIRTAHGLSHDHVFTATPQEAFEMGADYIVIGRQITTDAPDPEKALEEMLCG
jgi:orotidine-5'-phosphate decarboxylase